MKIYVLTKLTSYNDGYEVLDYESEVIGAYTSFDAAYDHAKKVLDEVQEVKKVYYGADHISATYEYSDEELFYYIRLKVDDVNIEIENG